MKGITVAINKYTMDLCSYHNLHTTYRNKFPWGLHPTTIYYNYNHLNKSVDVENGRDHLISCQWCESLTSARRIIINVNDFQYSIVHLWIVNRWVGVEHPIKSYDQRPMMWICWQKQGYLEMVWTCPWYQVVPVG